METSFAITVSLVGETSGKPFNGKFMVKTVLSRRERFLADERRRYIIGSNFQSALPALHEEAFKLGQLFVRLTEGPDWWKNSDSGLELEDGNVIDELYRLAEEKVAEKEKELKEQSKASLEKMAGKETKKVTQKSE